MKRLLCLILVSVILLVSALFSSAFTLQSSRNYQSADDSGAYDISFSGSHVDITRYSSDTFSAGLNLSYAVSGVCAYHGRAVMFCNDINNNQLIIYVYYLESDTLDSFALYNVKLYNDTDFCCDDSAIYIENHRDNRELISYSYNGNLSARYRFDQRITALCNGYRSGIFAVSDDTLYRLSGGGFTAVSGAEVASPLFPASSDIIVSDYGLVYVMDGNRIIRSFSVDSDFGTVSACVIGGRLYYPCGPVINGYDISDGSKVSALRLSFEPTLLFADGGRMIAVADSSYTAVSPGDFDELNKTDSPIDSNRDNDRSDNKRNENSDNNAAVANNSDISSDVYQVDFERYYISGIRPETTVAAFKRNMHYDGWNIALYRDGEAKTSGNVGTAMTAVFSSDEGNITFELSVSGDLTGEGNCNSRDISTLLDYLIGAADFNGVYTIAADLSGDGTVDAVDAAKLKRLAG